MEINAYRFKPVVPIKLLWYYIHVAVAAVAQDFRTAAGRIETAQILRHHLAVKEQDRAERLILRALGHPSIDGQVGRSATEGRAMKGGC